MRFKIQTSELGLGFWLRVSGLGFWFVISGLRLIVKTFVLWFTRLDRFHGLRFKVSSGWVQVENGHSRLQLGNVSSFDALREVGQKYIAFRLALYGSATRV